MLHLALHLADEEPNVSSPYAAGPVNISQSFIDMLLFPGVTPYSNWGIGWPKLNTRVRLVACILTICTLLINLMPFRSRIVAYGLAFSCVAASVLWEVAFAFDLKGMPKLPSFTIDQLHGNRGCCGQDHGGRPAAALDVDPPPPSLKMAKMFGRSRPRLARKAPQLFFQHVVGGKFSFLPQVCILKMHTTSWGMQICRQNSKKFSDPKPSPSSAPNWLLGPDLPGGKIFFSRTPKLCVKKKSVRRGDHFEVCMLGYPGPISAAPLSPPAPPPLQGAKMFRGCRRWGLHLGAPMVKMPHQGVEVRSR